MDDDRWDEQVGSVAEEAQRLLESLRRSGPGGDAAPETGHGTPDPDGDTSPADEHAGAEADGGERFVCTDPFCRACPLCRTVAVARGLSPETLRRLADLATVAAGVLSDLAGERARRPTEPSGDQGPDDPTAAGRAPHRAEPIPVRDADGDAAGG